MKEIPELTYTSNILKNMKRFLKVIYTYSFDTNELIQDKLWFIQNSSTVCFEFARLCGKYNYYSHSGGVHFSHLLQTHGSIYKYCNDIQETIGYYTKNCFRGKSNRHLDWHKQVLVRSWMAFLISIDMGEFNRYDGSNLEMKKIESIFHLNI